MEYTCLSYPTLQAFCAATFRSRGFSEEDSAQITDVLLAADRFGIESHGVQRLKLYHDNIRKGLVHPENQPKIAYQTPLSAVVDGQDAMGQLIGAFSMKLAIEKANNTGVGLVAARNSNHYGIAGYYALMAARKGLVGICMTNSEAILVPTRGLQPMLGTNPIAVCAPAEPVPFWFDAATTVVPRGKVEVCQKRETPLPEGWAVDETGAPCQNAGQALQTIDRHGCGGLLPLGGISEQTGSHKGYGYAMLCEIATAIASGSPTSGHTYKNGRCETSQFFAAVSPCLFGDSEALKKHLSDFLEEIRQSVPRDPEKGVLTHGWREWENEKKVLSQGVPAAPKTIGEMKTVAKDCGIDFAAYWGDTL